MPSACARQLVPIAPPTIVRSKRRVLLTSGGLPVILYVGTEYCSFCATERWALIAALSRFGTFSTLDEMESSAVDFAPNTPTFTFYGSRYSSPYLVFRPYELETDVLGANGYPHLMTVPASLAADARHIDPALVYPLVDVGGRAIARSASFSPMTLAGLSRDEVAGDLVDPTNPVTEGIVASANYLSATICDADGERPVGVCASSGVVAADRSLGIDGRAR